MINTTAQYVQAMSWLVQSRESGIFQLPITSGWLKWRGGTVKNTRNLWMTWNSRESSATKAPSKKSFTYTPNTRVPSWAYGVPWLMVFAATEFHDFLCAHYKVNPSNLKNIYKGCMQNVLVHHTLSFPNGYLIIALHNEIRGGVIFYSEMEYCKCIYK